MFGYILLLQHHILNFHIPEIVILIRSYKCYCKIKKYLKDIVILIYLLQKLPVEVDRETFVQLLQVDLKLRIHRT